VRKRKGHIEQSFKRLKYLHLQSAIEKKGKELELNARRWMGQ
jgi:hypothetical protein